MLRVTFLCRRLFESDLGVPVPNVDSNDLRILKTFSIGSIGVRAGGAAAPPPVSEIFGQNAQNSGNKETIKNI